MRENMKIMVVEDDIDLSELIRMYLIPSEMLYPTA